MSIRGVLKSTQISVVSHNVAYYIQVEYNTECIYIIQLASRQIFASFRIILLTSARIVELDRATSVLSLIPNPPTLLTKQFLSNFTRPIY